MTSIDAYGQKHRESTDESCHCKHAGKRKGGSPDSADSSPREGETTWMREVQWVRLALEAPLSFNYGLFFSPCEQVPSARCSRCLSSVKAQSSKFCGTPGKPFWTIPACLREALAPPCSGWEYSHLQFKPYHFYQTDSSLSVGFSHVPYALASLKPVTANRGAF